LRIEERGLRSEGKADDRVLERLRWRSRRGMLELDLILTRFLQAKLETLSQEEIGIFDDVLRLLDNDFLDLLMGRAECLDQRIKPMINMIRAA
jgi:succinate dehydrogenase flavin-adding protein (antitoxin of CptAB toxin-antitoxin module)